MEITLLGLVLVPLSLRWAFNPVRLLQLTLIAAVFEAAAALVIGGSLGLQPAMVPGLLFILYIIIQYAIGMRYSSEGTVFKTLFPLLCLMFYAGVSAFVLTDAFAGRIIVWPQKIDLLAPGPKPLAFSFGNITQLLYLIIDISITVAVALFITRGSMPYSKIIGAYMVAGYTVIVLVFWQLASRVGGVPFPDDLLHSNPGWAIVDQTVGAVPRLQGPYSEPAALAVFLCGMTLCCLWLCIRGYQLMRPNLLLALSIVCVLLSTSTTGIVTIIVGIPAVLAVGSISSEPGSLRRIGKTIGLLLLGCSLAIGPIFILKPDLMDAVNLVVEGTLSKGESDSYAERSEMDAAAVNAMEESYGLGVGWGSFRSSSFVPGMLANAGVFGIAMILWLVVSVYRLGKRARAVARHHPGQILVDGFSAALCGHLAAAAVSAPMIGSLSFYVQLGCVVGVLARMSTQARRRPVATTMRARLQTTG